MTYMLEPDYQIGKQALVLGASADKPNIGNSIADRLGRAGYNVTADDCKAPDADRYDAPDVPYSNYDVCVITVGTTHMEPFNEVSKAAMDRVLYGSLVLPLECARRYVQARDPDMVGDREVHVGTLIFIGSYAYSHPFSHCTTYCAAKAGLNMAVQSLAWELMPVGFHVHIINPHHVQGTPMTDDVLAGMQKGIHEMTYIEALEYQRKDLRMPDLLKPSDIADMVMTILDYSHMGWLSGQPINMFGGVR